MDGSRARSFSLMAVRSEMCDRPKSASLTRPSYVSSMFSGFRSRWTMPHACKCSRASVTSAMSDTVWVSSSTPRRCKRCFTSDERHSITKCSRSMSSNA
eukprot:3321279-Pleurochrysis_carterae.AAC.1